MDKRQGQWESLCPSWTTDGQTGARLTLVVLQDVGGKASLITHIGGVFAVFGFDDVLQVVVDLNTNTSVRQETTQTGEPISVAPSNLSANSHGLMEVGSSDWKDHELLHGQFISCMTSSIDDIEGLKRETSQSVFNNFTANSPCVGSPAYIQERAV